MLERYSFGFYEVMLRAEHLRSDAELLSGVMPDYKKPDVESFLADLISECEALGLTHTRDLASHISSRFNKRGKNYTYADSLNDLENLIFTFGNELRRELFVRVPRDKEALFQADALFGAEVGAAFPSSAADVQHAGTSFALGLTDASVFHSMRVLEAGLRAMAREIGVPFDRKNWANIIDAIESAVSRNSTAPGVDPKRRKVIAEAALHFRFLKDAWRNDVMHAGEVYDTGKAQSVLDHVGDFMRALADAGLTEASP